MLKLLNPKLSSPVTQRIYKDVRFGHLVNSYMILSLSQFDYLVDNSEKLVNISKKVLGSSITFWLLSKTVGQQFTGGSSLKEVKSVCTDLSQRKFHIAVNYLAEYLPEFNNDQFFDASCKRYLEAFDLAKFTGDRHFFNAIKVSGMIEYNLLKRMNQVQEKLEDVFWCKEVKISNKGYFISSAVLERNISNLTNLSHEQVQDYISLLKLKYENDFIYLVEWRLGSNSYNIFDDRIRKHAVYKALTGYTEDELNGISKFMDRLLLIINKAKQTHSNILFDAEQSYLQKTIYNIAEQLMYHENKPDFYFIFNTVQNYTIESVNLIDYELHKLGFFGPDYPLLMKMVRGAYLDEEKRLSKKRGYQVCWNSKELTDEAYNQNSFKLLYANTKYKKILIATHNNESLEMISDSVQEIENNIAAGKLSKILTRDQVYFGTLLGLNDYLAFHSLDKGFNTLKYIPYGESHIMLPYLIRRGVECRDLIKRSDREISSIKDEIMMRLLIK